MWKPGFGSQHHKKQTSQQARSKNEKLGLACVAIKCCKELVVYKTRPSAILLRPHLFHSAVLMCGNFSAGGARQVGRRVATALPGEAAGTGAVIPGP